MKTRLLRREGGRRSRGSGAVRPGATPFCEPRSEHASRSVARTETASHVHGLDVDAAVGERGRWARVREAGVTGAAQGESACVRCPDAGSSARSDDGLAALDGDIPQRLPLLGRFGGFEPGRELAVELVACGASARVRAAQGCSGRGGAHHRRCTRTRHARLGAWKSEALDVGPKWGRDEVKGSRGGKHAETRRRRARAECR